MKKLKFKTPIIYNHHYEYVDDIDRIVKVFADRGYEISREDCVLAWESYSELEYAAGWLVLPESDEFLYNEIRDYFEEVE